MHEKNEKYLAGVKVNFGYTMPDVLERARVFLKDTKAHYICTTNPEFVLTAQKNPVFRDIINRSDLSVPDGIGILYANHYLEHLPRQKNFFYRFFYGLKTGIGGFTGAYKLGERITGVDLFLNLCEVASKENYSIFLLGGRPKDKWGRVNKSEKEVSELVAEKLRQMFPGIRIVGYTSAYSPKDEDDALTVSFIHESMKEKSLDSVDLLFIAYGHPHQEEWLVRNIDKIPARLGIGVGGAFDYVSGIQKSSPKSFSNMHLDWLYRLFTQPWRLRRSLSASFSFPILIFKSSLKQNTSVDSK